MSSYLHESIDEIAKRGNKQHGKVVAKGTNNGWFQFKDGTTKTYLECLRDRQRVDNHDRSMNGDGRIFMR